MCGLFGAASSRLDKSELEDVRLLALLSTTRGIDSTGMAMFGHGKKGKLQVAVRRKLGNAASFFLDEEVKKGLDINHPYIAMGHTRWATLGAVNDYNSHPIEENGIILCHNGSIDHFCRDRNNEKDSDSRELARRLAKKPLDEVISEIGSGHFAITFANLNKRTLSFVRNEHRPLCFMYTANEDTVYWASETWMLKSLAYRNGAKHYKDPFLMDVHNVFELPFGRARGKATKLDIKPWWKLMGPINKATSIFNEKAAIRCGFCKELENDCLCGSTTGVPLLEGPKRPAQVIAHYSGYENVIVPVMDMVNILREGCAGCNKPQTPMNKVKWFADDAFVCEDCYDNDPICQAYLVKDLKCYEGKVVRPN